MTTQVWTIGQVVPFAYTTNDADGCPANPTTAELTVTPLPSGTPVTVTLDNPMPGYFAGSWAAAAPAGLWRATFDASGENAGQVHQLLLVQLVPTGVPDLAEVKAYLGTTSYSDAAVQDALDAELVAQAQRCRLTSYGADLAQALKRRVARNLAARAVPIVSFTAFEGGSTTVRVTKHDAEVDRLEGPYRRRKVG